MSDTADHWCVHLMHTLLYVHCVYCNCSSAFAWSSMTACHELFCMSSLTILYMNLWLVTVFICACTPNYLNTFVCECCYSNLLRVKNLLIDLPLCRHSLWAACFVYCKYGAACHHIHTVLDMQEINNCWLPLFLCSPKLVVAVEHRALAFKLLTTTFLLPP